MKTSEEEKERLETLEVSNSITGIFIIVGILFIIFGLLAQRDSVAITGGLFIVSAKMNQAVFFLKKIYFQRLEEKNSKKQDSTNV